MGIDTRSLVNADAGEKVMQAQREIGALKEQNARLSDRTHVLESELNGRTTAASHQGKLLREVQEERGLRIGSLELDLAQTQSKLQDALALVQQLQLEKALCEQARRQADQLLSQRTEALERVSAEKLAAEQAYETRLEDGRLKFNRLLLEVADSQRQERLMCDKDLSTMLAQVEVSQNQCRDEKRAAAMIEEQLKQERHSHNTCEVSKNDVSHLLSELTEQQQADRARFGQEMQLAEISAANSQRTLQMDLDAARAEVASLKEAAMTHQQQLRECQTSLALSSTNFEALSPRLDDAVQGLRTHETLVADLQRALKAAVSEKEEAIVKSTNMQTRAEVEHERLQGRVELLMGELADARRAKASASAEVEMGERLLRGTEDRYSTAMNEVESRSRRSLENLQNDYDALLKKFVDAEQARTKFSFQLQDEEARGRCLRDSLQDEVQRLQNQLAKEASGGQAQAKADNTRIVSLEQENVRLQAQSSELARQLASLESLNRSLRERMQVIEKGG